MLKEIMPHSNLLYVYAAVHCTPKQLAPLHNNSLCAWFSAYMSMITPSSCRTVSWLLQIKILSSLITAVLPGIVLTIFLALLPTILALLNKKVQKMVSETDVEFGVVRKFFVFQVGSCCWAIHEALLQEALALLGTVPRCQFPGRVDHLAVHTLAHAQSGFCRFTAA